jgi:hypothetical protein
LKLQDALFNWLQIKTVSDARPDDHAAKETLSFFEEILSEDHQLTKFEITNTDDTMIHIRFESDGKSKTLMFQRETVEQLLEDIKSNPKYNNQ